MGGFCNRHRRGGRDDAGGVKETGMCDECVRFLHEALDLTVRGRTLDGIDRRAAQLSASVAPDEWLASGRFERHVERHNAKNPPWCQIETRSLTPKLWTAEQFDADLFDWETRARKHMLACHPL